MADWFVDSSRPASGDGQSWGNAWKNLSNIVWASVQPGDTIYLSGGTTERVYSGALVVGKAGTSGQRITITRGTVAGHNGTPVIDGGNSIAWGVDNGRTSSGYSYVTVRNIAVRNFTSGCFGIRFNTGFVAENCGVLCGSTGSAPRAFDIRSNVSPTIRGCTVTTPASTPGQTDGIYSQDNTGYLYEGNVFDISNTNGTGHSDAYQAHLDGGGTVRNNIFMSPTAAGDNKPVWLHAFLDGVTVDFYNNLCISRGGQSNVSYWRELAGSPHGTLRIWNNTIIGGGRGLNFERVTNLEVRNNIVWPDAAGTAVYSNLNDPAVGNVTYNLVWAPSATVARTAAAGNRTWSQWTTTDGFNASGVNADPSFVDKSASDFHLLSTSPAINAGVTIGAVASDFGGASRPQGPAFDIGAFEAPPSLIMPTFHRWTVDGWVPPLP